MQNVLERMEAIGAERNEKEWKFWMYDIGWGHVLDYIGVEWETPVAEQMKIGEV